MIPAGTMYTAERIQSMCESIRHSEYMFDLGAEAFINGLKHVVNARDPDDLIDNGAVGQCVDRELTKRTVHCSFDVFGQRTHDSHKQLKMNSYANRAMDTMFCSFESLPMRISDKNLVSACIAKWRLIEGI